MAQGAAEYVRLSEAGSPVAPQLSTAQQFPYYSDEASEPEQASGRQPAASFANKLASWWGRLGQTERHDRQETSGYLTLIPLSGKVPPAAAVVHVHSLLV